MDDSANVKNGYPVHLFCTYHLITAREMIDSASVKNEYRVRVHAYFFSYNGQG